jgi:predicted molibdopterin-dependent oxidoreductase YjgC
MREVRTICPYCGVGCGLILQANNGRLVGLKPDKDHPISKGTLCPKGATAHEFVHHLIVSKPPCCARMEDSLKSVGMRRMTILFESSGVYRAPMGATASP